MLLDSKFQRWQQGPIRTQSSRFHMKDKFFKSWVLHLSREVELGLSEFPALKCKRKKPLQQAREQDRDAP